MQDPEHDTIDLKDELGDIDEILAAGSLTVAAEGRYTRAVEWVLVSIANGIWAVVGLVLWLPQVTRAVLAAALRTVHAALTGQSSQRAVAGISRVSSSYVERFLSRRREPAFVGRRHEMRPFRLLAEIVWAGGFYLVILRWLAPDRFAPIWELLGSWFGWGRQQGTAAALRARELLTPDLASIDATRLQAGGVLLLATVLGVGLGFWLGRRRR